MSTAASQYGNTVSPQLLQTFTEYIANELGLSFLDERERELIRGLSAAASTFGFDRTDDFITWYLRTRDTPERIEMLASHLTNGETYFFRESRALNAVAQLLKTSPVSDTIRLWSAGCSSGEEAYSLAITAHTIIKERGGPKVSILATDINPLSLQAARKRVYRKWSFRGTPEWVTSKYFTSQSDDSRRLRQDIASMVQFARLNLALDPYPSSNPNTSNIDVIFCRNVLMYFVESVRNEVIKRFHACLTNRGFLALSASEGTLATSSGLFFAKAAAQTMVYVKTQALPETPVFLPTKTISSIACVKKASLPQKPSPILPSPIAPVSHHENIKQLTKHAREAFTAKRYPEVRRILEEDLKPHKDLDGQFLGLLAQACANMRDLDAAEHWGELAVKRDKLSPYLRFLLASIQMEHNKFDDAKANLKKALYIDSNFILALFELGNLYRQEKQFDKADKAYHNAQLLLRQLEPDALVPCGEGLSAAGLLHMIDKIPR
ncbi:CheR family methyltransferase [Desulfovibrio inopinatus]|uniref:CheR family methyltransferase n=1 Tax=Desulfovibrio inopinatus TaxID=102109 RepID=UPI000415DB1D|nr:protein-glutamate O-methyltransferase CheR [Desulfovibrio inopinatus]